jgi:hypothetical protein
MNVLKLFGVTFFVLLSGCSHHRAQAVATKQPYQRFVPISVPIPKEPANPTGLPWAGAFALDTKTGQLCYTYRIRENIVFNESLLTLPTCSDLFRQYPD